jgi:hypothetical protein
MFFNYKIYILLFKKSLKWNNYGTGFRNYSQNVKIFNKFVPPYWSISKTWLNFHMDDHGKQYKRGEKKKDKKINDVVITITNYNSSLNIINL